MFGIFNDHKANTIGVFSAHCECNFNHFYLGGLKNMYGFIHLVKQLYLC